MRRRRILLVDDDAGITRTLAMYLDAYGNCDVRIENRGEHALSAAREFRPDLVFLDIVMPDADGSTIAAEIKADPVLKNTPVIFLTALVSQHKTRGVQAQIGGQTFLAKPVDPDVVLTCIDKHVRTIDR